MWPFPINIRSFAPFKQFGGWFSGDNRGYSTSLSATSRLAQSFTVDPNKGIITGLKTGASPSYHPLLGTATASDDRGSITNVTIGANQDGSSTTSFTSTMAGHNPLVAGSPDIDVKTNFTLTENGKLTIKYADKVLSLMYFNTNNEAIWSVSPLLSEDISEASHYYDR